MVLSIAAAMNLSSSVVRIYCLRTTVPLRALATPTATIWYGGMIFHRLTDTTGHLVHIFLASPIMVPVRTRLEGTAIVQYASRTQNVQRANIAQLARPTLDQDTAPREHHMFQIQVSKGVLPVHQNPT